MKAQLRSTSIVAAFGVLGLLLVGPANAGAAETVTFYEDVLPIFQDNCQTCHRQAGQNITGIIAPMSLMTYEKHAHGRAPSPGRWRRTRCRPGMRRRPPGSSPTNAG